MRARRPLAFVRSAPAGDGAAAPAAGPGATAVHAAAARGEGSHDEVIFVSFSFSSFVSAALNEAARSLIFFFFLSLLARSYSLSALCSAG